MSVESTSFTSHTRDFESVFRDAVLRFPENIQLSISMNILYDKNMTYFTMTHETHSKVWQHNMSDW